MAMAHVHPAYFGSEYDCRRCNPVCGGGKHQWPLDMGTRTADGRVVLTMSIVPCGAPGCPVMGYGKHPFRVRVLRVKGFRLPPNTKRVDRASGAGNPYRLEGCNCRLAKGEHSHSRADSVKLFRGYANKRLLSEPDWLEPWRGLNVACFCPVSEECHGDVVLELANRERSGLA
ncbi:MAG: DUF4326 domain-containing protein [Nitrososphaerota archaeon]|nr:DUF4326 domain-containing protein [Nitrososphaerota archaeon]